MPNILDPTFWEQEADALYEDLLPLFLLALEIGMNGGTDSLPPAFQPLVNVNAFNQAAIDYAKQYRYSLIKGITDTTREQTQNAVAGWLQSGQSLDVLEQQIAGIFSEGRAHSIAITETTRVVAEGNAMVWKSTGFVNRVRFNTVVDDRVCPLCEPLDGEEFDVDDYGHKPPIHTGCRCFNTPVVDEEAVAQQVDEILA